MSTEKKIAKEEEVYTLDGAVDRHGHPAIRGKTGTWVSGILLLGKSPYLHCNLQQVHAYV